jgi:hypothetical protein
MSPEAILLEIEHEEQLKKAKSYQVAGKHYTNKKIQPIDYIIANELDFCEGNVIKYITRYKDKNGVEDLQKAKQYIEFLIENLNKERYR